MKANRRTVWVALAMVLTTLLGCRSSDPTQDPALPWEQDEVLRFHAPNLAVLGRQQDFYIIQVRSEADHTVRTIVIDTGNYDEMLSRGLTYLKSHNIQKIDDLFITHAHKDHYGGLQALLESNVIIDSLYFNIPLRATCDGEIPWGCDYAHVQNIINAAKARGVTHREWYVDDPLHPEQVLHEQGIDLSLLWAPHGMHPELGAVDINDQSMVMRLNATGTSFLLTGDLNIAGAALLFSKLGDGLKSDILKVPHHAAESTAGNEFLEAVDPVIAIVPTHSQLWCSDRSRRVRTLLQSSGVKTYTMDFSGDIIIRHFVDRTPLWVIEKQPMGDCPQGR